MAQITGLIAWPNKNYDYQLTSLSRVILNSWVVSTSDLAVTTNSVAAGEGFILCTRTNGQKIMVDYNNTSAVTIDTTGTKKVWIGISQSVVDDGSGNALDGTGIATIQTGALYPSSNYIPLATIVSGAITDDRQLITGKPITRSGFPTSKTVYVDPATGDEVVKDSALASSIADTDLILPRDATTGNEKRVPFSNLKNQLGSAGKYVQTVPLGEAISAGVPTAMAVVSWAVVFTNTLGANIAGSRTLSGITLSVPYDTTLGIVKNSQNATSTSARIQLRSITGTLIAEQTPTVGSNTVTFPNTPLTGGTTYRLVLNDTANFNNNNNELILATYQANFQFATGGTNNGTDGVIPQNIQEVQLGTKKAMKAVANSTNEYAQVAWFITWPKTKWDIVDLIGSSGTVVDGFSGLSGIYYVTNTAGVIGLTPWTIVSVIGKWISTKLILGYQGLSARNGYGTYTITDTWVNGVQRYSSPIFINDEQIDFIVKATNILGWGYSGYNCTLRLQISIDWVYWQDIYGPVNNWYNWQNVEFINVKCMHMRGMYIRMGELSNYASNGLQMIIT